MLLLWTAVVVAGVSHAEAAEQAVAPADEGSAAVAITIKPVRPNYPGDPLTISAVLQDPDVSEAEYQFLVDDTIIQSWGPSGLARWVPTIKDIGRHELEVRVRSPAGTLSGHQSIYIYRRPVLPSDYDSSTH